MSAGTYPVFLTKLLRFGAVPILVAILPSVATADSLTLAHSRLIWPSAAVAFPTGRFGTPDPSTNHAGHKTGFDAGMDFGYAFNDFFTAGISGEYLRFPMDFGNANISPNSDPNSARTSVLLGHVWMRTFWPGGFAHWRPYALFAVGIGGPRARINSREDTLISYVKFSVNTSLAITGGIGVLIPVSNAVAFSFEPRLRRISTKGSKLTEIAYLKDGTSETVLEDHQKSNTTWWELRAGLSLMVK
ncbi:MAG: hypothetical protein HZB43_06710 [candidate division Zixibacteria bacterium]|nr:hypothetical protein [candidate division Zixibacteria bacterium]